MKLRSLEQFSQDAARLFTGAEGALRRFENLRRGDGASAGGSAKPGATRESPEALVSQLMGAIHALKGTAAMFASHVPEANTIASALHDWEWAMGSVKPKEAALQAEGWLQAAQTSIERCRLATRELALRVQRERFRPETTASTVAAGHSEFGVVVESRIGAEAVRVFIPFHQVQRIAPAWAEGHPNAHAFLWKGEWIPLIGNAPSLQLLLARVPGASGASSVAIRATVVQAKTERSRALATEVPTQIIAFDAWIAGALLLAETSLDERVQSEAASSALVRIA